MSTSSRRLEEFETTRDLREVCLNINRVFVSVYGPAGSFQANSSDGSRILNITTTTPKVFGFSRKASSPGVFAFNRIFENIVQAQKEIYGDGGKFLAGLTSKLILYCLDHEFQHNTVNYAYRILWQWVESFLKIESQFVLKVALDDILIMRGIVRNILSTYGLARLNSVAIEDMVSKLLEAFLSSLSFQRIASNSERFEVKSNVQFLTVQGEVPSSSMVFRNAIVIDLPLPSSPFDLSRFSSPTRKLKLALYDVSLMFGDSELIPNSDKVAEKAFWTPNKVEADVLQSFVNGLLQLEIDVVASQKVMLPKLRFWLLTKGVLVLDRLSLKNIGLVQRISNARILSRVTIPAPEDLGSMDSIQITKVLAGKYHIVLRNKEKAVATLALCAVDKFATDELCLALEFSLKALHKFLKDPVVLPGKGKLEKLLLEELRRKIQHWRSNHSNELDKYQILMGFVKSLEWIVETLGLDAWYETKDFVRIQGELTATKSPMDYEVYELRSSKLSAIRTSLETAISLYRIGGIIIDR